MVDFPTSNTIIDFPSGALNPSGDTIISQISETTANLISTMLDSGLNSVLQNPVVETINTFSSFTTSMASTISGLSYLSVGDKNSLINALTGTGGLEDVLDDFFTHTNLLSGVIQPTTSSLSPGLDQILSAGSALNTLANTLNDASGCLNILGTMSGLFSGEQLTSWMTELQGYLNQLVGEFGDVANILARIIAITNELQSIINADIAYFNQVISNLRTAALASLLGNVYNDPCGKYIIDNVIGRSSLINQLSG